MKTAWQPREYDELDFEVGDKVHYRGWTDVYPCTVVKVTPKTIEVRRDKFERDPEWEMEWIEGGFAGHLVNNHQQRNIIEEDPNGAVFRFSRRLPPKSIREYHSIPAERGWRWILVGSGGWRDGSLLLPGWQAFHDYNF